MIRTISARQITTNFSAQFKPFIDTGIVRRRFNRFPIASATRKQTKPPLCSSVARWLKLYHAARKSQRWRTNNSPLNAPAEISFLHHPAARRIMETLI
jgi:hypothetical protein